MKEEFSFRLAVPEDAEQLLGIYARYVRETAVTFEYDVPSVGDFESRIREINSRFPWIVCELDNRIVGYAYASEYRERAAFKWSCELSVYVADAFHGRGIGKTLYLALLDILRLLGYRTALACVTYPNSTSDTFHKSLGFELVGIFPCVGYKMGSWCGVSWYQLVLMECVASPEAPIAIGEIPTVELENVFTAYADRLRCK